MVFVARLTVDGPFHKGLLRNIQLSQTVDYDMHMDIAAAVVTVHVGADQRLMPRKVSFYIFHADGLRLFTCQFTLVFVGRIEADEVVVRLDFIVILILVVLRIKHFALHIKKFRLTVYALQKNISAEYPVPVCIQQGFLQNFIILKNEVYTGTMVQGRRQKINYKIKKIRDVEESGWIRVPNMHEAIIPQKLFDTVQEVLKLDTCASKGQQTVNLFSGIVRCGGCGQNMVRRIVSKNGKKYIYLHCVTNHNGLGCSSHLISESKLEEVVLAALQGKVQQISGLEHRLDEINEIPKNERRLKSVEEHLKMLEQEEQKYQTLRRQLYEDMSSGIVSKEEYKEFSHSFNEKVEAIRKAKAEMNRQRDCLNNLDVEHLPWIEDFKSYQNLTSLNRRVLVELVESITVYDKEHIHIQYRFDQEIRNVLEYCSSVPAAETEESAV